MVGTEFICAREECGNKAEKQTHNQKYCSNECCRVETNRKIMEKYHEKAAIRRGKKRECVRCGVRLSRYNESKICGGCHVSEKEKHAGEAARLLASISWL